MKLEKKILEEFQKKIRADVTAEGNYIEYINSEDLPEIISKVVSNIIPKFDKIDNTYNKTQYQIIKEHLLHFGNITSYGAIKMYKITRVGAIIPLLRKREGMKINSILKPTNDGISHYAVYTLE